ncbi:hypothetical protein, partial [Pseudomonas gelidaquae]|uniref:hypothetical protein n=1 Tax=Pseudomonas sp. IB20 TaxID=1702250 RepID=UPI001C47F0FD
PFGYFWGSFPKVTRRKGGTNSRRYRSNGYVLNIPKPSQAKSNTKSCVDTYAHRRQASSHS